MRVCLVSVPLRRMGGGHLGEGRAFRAETFHPKWLAQFNAAGLCFAMDLSLDDEQGLVWT